MLINSDTGVLCCLGKMKITFATYILVCFSFSSHSYEPQLRKARQTMQWKGKKKKQREDAAQKDNYLKASWGPFSRKKTLGAPGKYPLFPPSRWACSSEQVLSTAWTMGFGKEETSELNWKMFSYTFIIVCVKK